MSNVKKIFWLILALVFEGQAGFSQVNEKNCMDMLLNYYKELNIKYEKNKNKTYHTEMIYKTWLNTRPEFPMAIEETTINTVDIYTFNKRVFYKNEQLEVFIDSKDLFTVIKPDKKIIWQDVSEFTQSGQADLQDLFRDSLFMQAELKSCTQAPDEYGPNVIKIELLLSEKYIRLTKAHDCTVYFDKKDKKLVALSINYLPSYKYRKQHIKFVKQEFINSNLLKNQVRNNFINNKQQVLSQYRTYQFLDYRKK